MSIGEELLRRVAEEVRRCRRCPLTETRRNPVPGEGPASAEIMFIGEAPGYYEDLSGRPFVGQAGNLLTKLLKSIGLRRENVFITNVVKCRPPGNRPPRLSEAEACRGFLKRQMEIVRPKIICLLGNSALNALLGERERLSIGRLHGKPIKRDGVMYLPMYHPAAALYDKGLEEVLRRDMEELKRVAECMG